MKNDPDNSVKPSARPEAPTPMERSGYAERSARESKALGDGVRLGDTVSKFDKFTKEIVAESFRLERLYERNWEKIKADLDVVTHGVEERNTTLRQAQYRSVAWSVVRLGSTGSAIFVTGGLGAFACGLAFSKAMVDLGVHLSASPEQSAEWSASGVDVLFDPFAMLLFTGLKVTGSSNEKSVELANFAASIKSAGEGLTAIASKSGRWTNLVDVSGGVYDVLAIGQKKKNEIHAFSGGLP
jgi:hypothetical protein